MHTKLHDTFLLYKVCKKSDNRNRHCRNNFGKIIGIFNVRFKSYTDILC